MPNAQSKRRARALLGFAICWKNEESTRTAATENTLITVYPCCHYPSRANITINATRIATSRLTTYTWQLLNRISADLYFFLKRRKYFSHNSETYLQNILKIDFMSPFLWLVRGQCRGFVVLVLNGMLPRTTRWQKAPVTLTFSDRFSTARMQVWQN